MDGPDRYEIRLPIASIGLISIVALLVYKYVAYPTLISPLARLPSAHPSCALTSTWFERQVKNSRELRTLYALHQSHGPIVRLGPNEVSVVSEEGLRKIFVVGFDKDVWYQKHFYNYGKQNLVCTLDHRTHSTHKRMISGVYQKSYLHHSTDMGILSRHIILKKFLPLLESYATVKKDVDVVQLFEWTGVDIISAYLFGSANGTDFLRDEQSRNLYFGEWKRMRESSDYSKKPITEDLFLTMCKAAIAKGHDQDVDKRESTPVVISKMFEQMLALRKTTNYPPSDEDVMTTCASEMLDHVIATQETMTITWTYLLYRLSLHPELQQRLSSELAQLHPTVSLANKDYGLPSPTAIDGLPLLNAIVYETLRLHAANPARMRRIVPPRGVELHEYYIPAGTKVSTNAYCLHRHEEAFPQPNSWLPERWIPDRREDTAAFPTPDLARKSFWAFGSGPRMCIGHNFAVQVLKLVVAAIYTQHTTTIVDDEGIEQTDAYNSGPASHRLILSFDRAEMT